MPDALQPSNDFRATSMAVAASIASAHRTQNLGKTPEGAKDEAKLVRELYLLLVLQKKPQK